MGVIPFNIFLISPLVCIKSKLYYRLICQRVQLSLTIFENMMVQDSAIFFQLNTFKWLDEPVVVVSTQLAL